MLKSLPIRNRPIQSHYVIEGIMAGSVSMFIQTQPLLQAAQLCSSCATRKYADNAIKLGAC
jgi:hypothetical protein